MKHEVRFERGYDCITFECVHGVDGCKPGSGGSHGRHGLTIRFLVHGTEGAVQFSLYTGWVPFCSVADNIGSRMLPDNYGAPGSMAVLPADLGYHARKPQYDEQEPRKECPYLDGADCYYDGSGLNATDAFYALVNGGDHALWAFLEAYYKTVFEGCKYPTPAEYPAKPREATK